MKRLMTVVGLGVTVLSATEGAGSHVDRRGGGVEDGVGECVAPTAGVGSLLVATPAAGASQAFSTFVLSWFHLPRLRDVDNVLPRFLLIVVQPSASGPTPCLPPRSTVATDGGVAGSVTTLTGVWTATAAGAAAGGDGDTTVDWGAIGGRVTCSDVPTGGTADMDKGASAWEEFSTFSQTLAVFARPPALGLDRGWSSAAGRDLGLGGSLACDGVTSACDFGLGSPGCDASAAWCSRTVMASAALLRSNNLFVDKRRNKSMSSANMPTIFPAIPLPYHSKTSS